MLLKYLKDKVSDADLLQKTQLYANMEREFESKKRNEAIKNFAFGFTVGSLITGVTALFLLPKSGKEFRKDAKETVYRVVNIAEEKGEKVKEKGKKLIKKGIESMRTSGKSILMVEHEIENLKIADEILLLKDGKLNKFEGNL